MNNLPKDTIGLDIESSAITAAQFGVSGSKLNIINYGRIELEPGIVDDNCIIVDPKSFKEALAKLMQNGATGRFTSRNAIIAIPEEKTFTHILSIPREHINDEEFIIQSAKDFIPIDLTEASVDYKPLDGFSSGNELKIHFAATQKSIIDSVINIITEAGLNVVFVDVDKNSIIRACANQFRKTENDFMTVDINEHKTTFSINGKSGFSYTLDSDIAGRKFIEEIKKAININTVSDIKSLLIELGKKGETSDNAIYQKISDSLKEPFNKLIRKIKKIINIAKNDNSINIKEIFIIGNYSRMPGFSVAFKKAFPGMRIITEFDYIKLGPDTETYYAKAIGLALMAVLPKENAKEINLLPQNKKEELSKRMFTPVLIKALFSISVCLAVFVLFFGIYAVKSYIDFTSGKKEAETSLKNLQNPYFNSVVKTGYESVQLKTQIGAITGNVLPGSKIMQKIDSYNANGIELISAIYKLNTNNTNSLHIRAKTVGRTQTEKFIENLKKDSDFSQIISPLSNLAGKSERFIDIDFVLNIKNIISDFEKQKNGSAKSPAIQSISN